RDWSSDVCSSDLKHPYICVLSTRFLLLKNSRFLFVVKLALFKLFQDDPAREKHPDGSTCLSLLEKLFTTKRLRYFFRHKSLQVLIIYIYYFQAGRQAGRQATGLSSKPQKRSFRLVRINPKTFTNYATLFYQKAVVN